MTIAPGNIQQIELADELAKLGVPTPVKESGVDIDYQAPPGSLIGHLVSADQNGTHSFEVPIKDAFAWNAMVEGIYPWTLENGERTILHLKNRTDKPVNAWTTITFPGGVYTFPLLSFQPYQTIAIDIQDLKDSQKADSRGKSFPADATHGQIVWFPKTPYTLVGRAERPNLSEGIAHSFSCSIDCCNNFQEYACTSTGACSPTATPRGAIIPVSGLTGVVGGSGQLTSYLFGSDCNSNPFGPSAASAQSWSSNDTSVATVDGSGNVSYIDSGSTTISADIDDYVWDWGPNPCQCVRTPATITSQFALDPQVTQQAPVTINCGDQRDNLIQEYRNYPTSPTSPFIPTCNLFSQYTHSVYFSAAELRVNADYSWALIRIPLTQSSGYGLDQWRVNYGSARIMNSAYRNPAHNAAVGGVPASQHLFGTASDLRNQSGGTTEYNNMVTAAQNAAADFIEPTSGPCAMACVHSDWRNHNVGQYAHD